MRLIARYITLWNQALAWQMHFDGDAVRAARGWNAAGGPRVYVSSASWAPAPG